MSKSTKDLYKRLNAVSDLKEFWDVLKVNSALPEHWIHSEMGLEKQEFDVGDYR